MQILSAFDWDVTLIQYNYSDENFQAGVRGLKAAHEKGMSVIIMEPLLGGRLANALPEAATQMFNRENTEDGINRTPAEWAFDWIWNQPEPTVVLSGMNSLDMLIENITSASRAKPGCLTAHDLAVIAGVREIWDKSNKVNCTGCGYCSPCPYGVNIPGCFSSYNISYSRGYAEGLKSYFMSNSLLNSPQTASKCIACHRGEKFCPQKLPIPELLLKVRKRLEPAPFIWGMSIARKFMKKK
jgi:predicted aldo/keto reductase-like oxidoreductase